MKWIEAEEGKVCVVDTEGDVHTVPQIQVDRLYRPSNGFCVVTRNGQYGYINLEGELVIPFQYKKAYPFSENGVAFVVEKDGLGGYINQNGEYVTASNYETGSLFRFGFAVVSKDGQYEYIYESGQKAVNHTFQYASGFSPKGLATVVTSDGKHQLMDEKSRVKLTLIEGYEFLPYTDDYTVTVCVNKGMKALVGENHELVTGFYDELLLSSTGLHRFSRNGLWGYVDNDGKEVIPANYLEADDFSESGEAKVIAYHPLTENNRCEFYIDRQDEVIEDDRIEVRQELFEHDFEYVSSFKDGLALAEIKVESDWYEEDNEENNKELHTRARYAIYEIELEFYNKKEQEVLTFIREVVGYHVKITGIAHNYAKIIWVLEEDEEPETIEIMMYYALKEYNIGDYNYYRIE